MENGLDYFQTRLEYEYYSKNPDIISCHDWCMQKGGLPCNCITGLLLNYAGYVLHFCYEIPRGTSAEIELLLDNEILYPSASVESNHVRQIVTTIYDKEGEMFLWRPKKCNQSNQSEKKVYYQFREYKNWDELRDQLSYLNVNWNIRFANANYWMEFWIYFLSALRVTEYGKANRAFMLMAILMACEDMLEMFMEHLKTTPDMAKDIGKFINDYFDLLKKMEGIPYGPAFPAKFSKNFKIITEIPIAEFIESVNRKIENSWVDELLYTQFARSCSMCRDKYSVIWELVKKLDELTGSGDYEKALSNLRCSYADENRS